jgi:hypothetical protein
MQPTYLTLTSTTPSAWKLTNWHAQPFQIAFAVISSGGSSWFISGTLEDPTGVYPNPNSSTPTAFTIATGSCNIYITSGSTILGGTAVSLGPFAAYRFTLNTQSSAGAPVTLVTLLSGIG